MVFRAFIRTLSAVKKIERSVSLVEQAESSSLKRFKEILPDTFLEVGYMNELKEIPSMLLIRECTI